MFELPIDLQPQAAGSPPMGLVPSLLSFAAGALVVLWILSVLWREHGSKDRDSARHHSEPTGPDEDANRTD
ncbi:MAG: hypothetical protein ABEL76_15570 [Bradymonadaceae bacterium]